MALWWTIPIIVAVAFLIGFAWGRFAADSDLAKYKAMKESGTAYRSREAKRVSISLFPVEKLKRRINAP